MATASSSKVTVEYFDPSGIFPFISPGLLSRLPLRNLHWKSPSRPLRSIASVHVDLVQHERTSQDGTDQKRSADGTAAASDASGGETPLGGGATGSSTKATPKERRHQIPGLRQTPYLKVYLLRCDDNDTYKATSRKLLREWIRENTPGSPNASSASSQENHDAFEWLIVHVTLPNTGAAAQPRLSGSSGGAGGGDRPSSSSRWPGRGSSTLLEKIKADFNGSSKSATDRVVQIRLNKTDIPPHLLPESTGPIYQDDEEGAWTDLITKFKSLILTSFDLRVTQYEEDIREKDAQRTLPGWNFCTFFVLKEGLARGFESVGLIEDALVGYDELSAGLDAIVRDEVAEKEREGHGGAFRKFTQGLLDQLNALKAEMASENSREAQRNDPAERDGAGEMPLSTTNKNYRDLILSSNISIFEFRCYIFARQMFLLLRLANARSSHKELHGKAASSYEPGQTHAAVSASPNSEDLLLLSEICDRGSEFITSVARVMRIDLGAAIGQDVANKPSDSKAEHNENTTMGILIDNMVSSWTFSACQQILLETSTGMFAETASSSHALEGKTLGNGIHAQEPKTIITEPKSRMHPRRSSSLRAPSASTERFPSSESLQTPSVADLPRPGMTELASSRAELLLVEKSVLEHFGRRQSWHFGWGEKSLKLPGQSAKFEDISLDADSDEQRATEKTDGEDVSYSLCGVVNAVLRGALRDEESFGQALERHVDQILRHYKIANRSRSIAKAMVELGTMRFYQQDFAGAASYFEQVIRTYAEENWADLEMTLLMTYAHCLKKLDKKQEYVYTVLEVLAKIAEGEKQTQEQRGAGRLTESDPAFVSLATRRQEVFDDGNYLSELFAYSKDLPSDLEVPIDHVFGKVQLDPFPRHYKNKDGFETSLTIQHVFSQDITIDRIRVKLVTVPSGQAQDLFLESNESQTLHRGTSPVWLETNVTSPGTFILETITFTAQGVNFVSQSSSKSGASFSTEALKPTVTSDRNNALVHFYPGPEALDADLRLSRNIHLEKTRSIEVSLNTGKNHVSKGELRLRPGSAGLRLKISEAELVDGQAPTFETTRAGTINLGEVQPHTILRIQVPYLMEQEIPELSLRIEVAYTTEHGEFVLLKQSAVSIVLPLGVNVQDVYKKDQLLSKFTVSAASSVPLRVFRSSLESSEFFDVHTGRFPKPSMIIFPKQPAQLLYKISRRRGHRQDTNAVSKPEPLALVIEYDCLDEEIITSASDAFEAYLIQSAHSSLLRHLMPFFTSRLEAKLAADVLEMAALRGQIDIGSFEEMGWSSMLEHLALTSRDSVSQCLQTWHQEHSVIDLRDTETTSLTRQITIPVEVPNIQILHTVDLHVPGFVVDQASNPRIAAIGQMLPAEVQITHSRTWDQGLIQDDEHATEVEDEEYEFLYEVHANPESWIIGGRKRAKFSARAGQLRTFPVMLIPLRAGHLLLPSIEVSTASSSPAGTRRSGLKAGTARSSQTPETQGNSSGDKAGMTSEVDCRSQAQTILVLPDAKSTTVSVDAVTAGGAAWLVASEGGAHEVSEVG
ncbi:MAG: hypothetical protein M4579_002578 [Chaenotheca gracillima]|nr:MAG: hypothetical protein M4579_002578 [Chaenotheca gracillima]